MLRLRAISSPRCEGTPLPPVLKLFRATVALHETFPVWGSWRLAVHLLFFLPFHARPRFQDSYARSVARNVGPAGSSTRTVSARSSFSAADRESLTSLSASFRRIVVRPSRNVRSLEHRGGCSVRSRVSPNRPARIVAPMPTEEKRGKPGKARNVKSIRALTQCRWHRKIPEKRRA